MSEPTPTISRRSFLTKLGAVGGATAMYGAMEALGLVATPANAQPVDFRPPRAGDLPRARRRTKVAIIGAGTAGLAAAYELGKAGYDCHVLEATGRPGGRALTIRGGDTVVDTDGVAQTSRYAPGQYFNAGPARIPNHHVTLDYCRELGVKIEALVNANAEAYYYYENTGSVDYGPLASTPVRHRVAKADWFGYTAELLAKAVDQGALDDVLSVEDAERLVSFASSFGGLSGGRYVGGSRRGYTTTPTTEPGVVNGPPPDLSTVLRSRMGNQFAFELGFDQAMMMWQPVGGMDRISAALAEAVGRHRITYDAPVAEIANTPDGVRIVYQGRGARPHVLEAEYCIAAIPPMVLRELPSNLSSATQAALGQASGANTGKIGLQFGRRFWEEDEKIFGGITTTNLDVSGIWYPSYGMLGEKGVVIGYYSGAYTNLSVPERQARALAQGAKIHGQRYLDEFETAVSVAWPKMPYARGGWVNWSGGRGPGSGYEHLLQPDGRIYFAGDHMSYYTSWQAGAFESARKVVMDLHARVAAS